MPEGAFDAFCELELSKLIELTLEIGNILAGRPNNLGNVIFAEGLGQKLINLSCDLSI
jgi:hypothetical protein